MTGRERVSATMRGEATDHLPFMPITMMFAADRAGVKYQRYATDGQVLAETQLRIAEEFGFDHVSAISDPAREVADLGGAVEWFEDQPPAIRGEASLLEDKGKLAGMALPDPEAPGRMSDRVRGVRCMAERAGSLVVEGWVEGPCAMAADLRGMNPLMLDFHDDPQFVDDLMEYCVRMETRFAAAQVAAGATLVGIGDAAASLIGPRLYERFVLGWEQRLVEQIHALGVPARLHICGNTRKIVRGMGQTKCEIVDLDFLTPLAEARAAMGPQQVLLGNIDPVRALRDGTPESVYAAIAECHAQAGAHYIVSAGCETPRGTPAENVRAMARYAAEHH
ncbi:MAG: uroporphyrinogen decarboxylase family protein [Bryobacteraceae bacterium]